MNQARKRTGTKKVLSMILVLVMLLSLLSMAAFTLPASETGNSKDSYDYNIMFLDCGRKYFSVDSIKQIIDNASAAGFNYIQLAVGNDGLRFLLDNMSLTVNGTTYESSAVKSAIQKGNAAYNATFKDTTTTYNPETNELTESEMNTIIAYAKTKGMGVIPCVNTPGHMDAILSAANSLTGTTCSYSGSVRTIDVTNDTAVAFTKALLQKYITYFAGKGCQYFNMGADEYANDIYKNGSMGFGNLQSTGKYSFYVDYVNKVAAMIKAAKMTPMAFNDGIYFANNTSGGTFDTDIIVCYWSNGWSGYSPMPASDLAAKGFKLVNTNGSYYWVLGKTDAQCDAAKASNFNKTAFPGGTVSNPVGSMFCIWADYPGAETEASVISKTAATIAAFGKALPQIGIKSTSGTALTLNGSTELTVPGNAEATWSVEPAGVIELQVSGNADERSAITGTSVIAKAVGAGTAKVTATVNDKTTYTTTLTVTDPSTVDVTVAVNGTKTITVDGNVSGTLDNEIAKATTAPTTASEKKLELVTAIESGEQYLIVHQRSGLVLNDAQSDSGLLLNGKKDTSDQLWTITKAGTSNNKYTVKGVNEHFITAIGDGTATLGTSSSNLYLTYNKSGYWDICFGYYNYWELNYYYLNQYGGTDSTTAAGYTENGAADKGSRWEIYKVMPETKEQTTITFTGKSVGDTSVKIGDVTYKIHVVAEDLSKVTPLTIEYWITNSRLTGSDGNQARTIQATDKDVATEAGVNTADLVAKTGNKDGRTQEYWQTKILDVEKENNSTSGTELQVTKQGDDETLNGKAFTKVRYWGGAWQVYTTEWVNVDRTATSVKYTDDQSNTQTYTGDKNQLVAYYMEIVDIKNSNGTTNLHVNAADWGTKGDGTGNWGYTPESSRCSVSVQLVYEDSSMNPADTTADSLKSKTIVYGYWSGGRGLGTMIFNGEDNYQIIKVTAETGTMSSTPGSDNTVTVTDFSWKNNEETVWEGAATDSVSIGNPARNPSYDAPYDNLAWNTSEHNHNNAILIRVYVKSIPRLGALTVNYFVKGTNDLFYHYAINVAENTTFDREFARVEDQNAPGKAILVHNTVKNYDGEMQTVQSDLSKMTEIGAQYRYSDYTFVDANRSTDGKTVNLYYTFKAEKTFVIDFGLPLEIRPTDVHPDLQGVTITKVDIANQSTYANIKADDNGVITYTLNQRINGADTFSVYYHGYRGTGSADKLRYTITVIPATSVYYEDSFASFTDGTGKASGATWTTDKDSTAAKATTTQALSALGSKDVYGHDAAYADSTKLSMGSANKVTVSADMVKDWTDGSAWPTATFTFKGTGFDIISLTDNTSGAIFVDVYEGKEATGTPKKQFTVNNYYGYKQDNGKWVVDTERSNALYQIPVMKVSGLDYGEYTAVIRVAYSKFFDTAKKNQYSFWLDAIRVYDPMGKDNATYTQDNEGYPQYIKLRDALVGNTAQSQAVFIDGADKATIATYENYGPNNEVYLAHGQAITFNVPENDKIASIQIGAKAPSGSAAQMEVTGGKAQEIKSATEMYYEISKVGSSFTITNTGEGILSLTNLKITFTTSGQTVALSAPTAEEQNAAVMSVRALFAEPEQTFEPEYFTAKWSRNVRKGGTATLTVKASADVESITVNGEEITAYTTKTARSFWGAKETYHVFTYRVTNAATADYSICAVNADGVASDPITATLTVRPSIRDWWHNIFDKWQH